VLLFEPLNRYEDHMVNTVATAAELIAEAGSGGVRILADTYHMNIEEDDLCAALRSVRDVLGAVHLSDSNRAQPGTGHVPFGAVFETLREIGFDGVASVECRLRGEPAEAVQTCGRYLRGRLDAV
jgi:sugar phosphate isomerase/epimerase